MGEGGGVSLIPNRSRRFRRSRRLGTAMPSMIGGGAPSRETLKGNRDRHDRGVASAKPVLMPLMQNNGRLRDAALLSLIKSNLHGKAGARTGNHQPPLSLRLQILADVPVFSLVPGTGKLRSAIREMSAIVFAAQGKHLPQRLRRPRSVCRVRRARS